MNELEKELGEFTFSKLKGSARGQRSIEKAKIWLKTRYMFCQKDPGNIDYENKIIEEILLKRSVYELFSMSDQEEVALDKKEDALELLAGLLGPCVYQSTYCEPKPKKIIKKQTGFTIQKKSTRDGYDGKE